MSCLYTNYNDTGSPDFRETFLYVASELSHYNLAYLHAVDGITFGFHGLGEAMHLNEFREVFSGRIMGNCGYTKEAAELAIRDGRADIVDSIYIDTLWLRESSRDLMIPNRSIFLILTDLRSLNRRALAQP